MALSSQIQRILDYLLSLIREIIAKIKNFFIPQKTIKFDNGPTVKVSHKIAEGGFSYIYSATDTRKLNRQYALKRIICSDEEVIQLCQREAEVHRSVTGANVLQMYGIKFERAPQRVCYMLFPLIKGGSLRDEVSARNILHNNVEMARPIKEREILGVFKGILNGVITLHNAGYRHGDVKLENVLLEKSGNDEESGFPITTIGSQSLGNPVLMDFGSARKPLAIQLKDRRTVLTLTEEASSNSTISYRAPELFDGGCRHGSLEPDVDGKVDVWSLGCVLFGMMYGSSPFELEFRNGDRGISSDVRIVECTHLRVLACKIPFPSTDSRRETIFRYSQEIKELVEWILTVDRSERPNISDVFERVKSMLTTRAGEIRGFV